MPTARPSSELSMMRTPAVVPGSSANPSSRSPILSPPGRQAAKISLTSRVYKVYDAHSDATRNSKKERVIHTACPSRSTTRSSVRHRPRLSVSNWCATSSSNTFGLVRGHRPRRAEIARSARGAGKAISGRAAARPPAIRPPRCSAASRPAQSTRSATPATPSCESTRRGIASSARRGDPIRCPECLEELANEQSAQSDE